MPITVSIFRSCKCPDDIAADNDVECFLHECQILAVHDYEFGRNTFLLSIYISALYHFFCYIYAARWRMPHITKEKIMKKKVSV
jgi:hypothetical protein